MSFMLCFSPRQSVFAYLLYDMHSRMLLGEKQWSIIQTKTKRTKRLLRQNSKRLWILTKQ
uniref:Uncharacterized protein n=1 Tax=Arundo donax TaxID=35708 RepID=A0A0A9D812_ARUDO